MNGTTLNSRTAAPPSADKWRRKRDAARQNKLELDDVAGNHTVPLKNAFATLAPTTTSRLRRMEARASPDSPPPPPPPRRSRAGSPTACARREARVASLVRSSRDASPASSTASTPARAGDPATPVKAPARPESMSPVALPETTLSTPTSDVVSAAAASLRRAPARFAPADDGSPDAKTVNSAAAALAALAADDVAVAAGVVAHAAAAAAEKRESAESRDRSPPPRAPPVWRGGGVGGTLRAGAGRTAGRAAWVEPPTIERSRAHAARGRAPRTPIHGAPRKRPSPRKKGDPGLDAAAEAYADYFWPWRRKKRETAFVEDIVPRTWDIVGEGDCDDGAWRARWRTLRVVTPAYQEGDAVDMRIPAPEAALVDTPIRTGWADAAGRAAKDATSLDDSRPLVALSCVSTADAPNATGVASLLRGLDAGPGLPWRVSLRCVSLVGLGLGDEKALGATLHALTKLQCLDLSRNRLQAAPPQLPAGLVRLALSENRLKSCAKLEQLASLRVLDVAHCPITSARAFFPLVLCRMTLLELRVRDLKAWEPCWRRKVKDLFPEATVL